MVPELTGGGDKSTVLVQALRSNITPLRYYSRAFRSVLHRPRKEMLYEHRSQPHSLMSLVNPRNSNLRLRTSQMAGDVCNRCSIHLCYKHRLGKSSKAFLIQVSYNRSHLDR